MEQDTAWAVNLSQLVNLVYLLPVCGKGAVNILQGGLISILAKPFTSALPYINGIITFINLPCIKGGFIFKTLSSWYLEAHRLTPLFIYSTTLKYTPFVKDIILY
jgi:hypothetical protein